MYDQALLITVKHAAAMSTSPHQKASKVLKDRAGSIKMDMMMFAEFDKDGDQSLDFDEFYSMMPLNLRQNFTTARIKDWFDPADEDHSGALSLNEFFKWSLRNAGERYGSRKLVEAFKVYDKDGTGTLDEDEFHQVCVDLGFGAGAFTIFRALDEDGSGLLTYKELVDAMVSTTPTSPVAKQMLTALMWSSDERQKDGGCTVDTTGWAIHGQTIKSVQRELQRLLDKSGATVAELIKVRQYCP